MLLEEVRLAGLCHRRMSGTSWRLKQLSYNRSLICPSVSFTVHVTQILLLLRQFVD